MAIACPVRTVPPPLKFLDAQTRRCLIVLITGIGLFVTGLASHYTL
jgi:hypothetical protein